MEISDFSSFEEAKSDYSYNLSQALNKYDLTLSKYTEKIGEKNVSKIINPKDEKELTIAVKCLEIITESLEYAKSRNLTVEESINGTLYYLLIKGSKDKKYYAVAQDYIDNIISNPVLYGNYIVDEVIFDLDAIQAYILSSGIVGDELSALKAILKYLIKSSIMIGNATAKEIKNKDSYLANHTKNIKGKKGAEYFAEFHDVVIGYLNIYNSQQNAGETFAMTYRNKYRL